MGVPFDSESHELTRVHDLDTFTAVYKILFRPFKKIHRGASHF